MTQHPSIETPSGKGAGDENFPVGSLLLPKRLRPHVATFYAYARAIDDVADNPALTPEDKIARLERFARAVKGKDTEDPGVPSAHRVRESLKATQVAPAHCLELIEAFKQDAVKLRYADWGELCGYCRLSATPVGRYLLDLHGEDPSAYRYSDPLCDALQVINHLQDCAEDRRDLDRVYLPLDWLEAEGATVEMLDLPASTPELRRVLDRCLDATEETLMPEARALPHALKDTRLAAESAVIVRLADRLIRELRRRDPLAERVVLSKPRMALTALRGLADLALGRLRLSGKPELHRA